MQITSVIFCAFVFLIALLIYFCNKILKTDQDKIKSSKWILLLSSYAFVLYADITFAVILLGLTIITWYAAKNRIYKLGIISNIFVLIYFKYANFFIGSFSELFRKDDFVVLKIILPLGISFYVFSAIGYVVDVKRDREKAHSLLDVALYLAFFPKITLGPIQKNSDFFKQISVTRNICFSNVTRGIQIFFWGLFKKIVLADRLAVFVNQVYQIPKAFNSITVLLAVLAYSMQIYFDFSGYSDMAIGAAEVLDIKLPRNFNLPYISHNVSEFWKRWHITLSAWLQDYVYIPLGGNRKGRMRTYVNLILTMLIGGLWHGAQWTYVIWGALNGLALVVHKLWAEKTNSNKNKHSVYSNIICVITTYVFVSFCWIFFRAENFAHAITIIKIIFSGQKGIFQPYIWVLFAGIVYVVSVLFATIHTKERKKTTSRQNFSWIEGYYPVQNLKNFWGLVKFFVFVGLTIGLAYTGGSPFIYGAY